MDRANTLDKILAQRKACHKLMVAAIRSMNMETYAALDNVYNAYSTAYEIVLTTWKEENK